MIFNQDFKEFLQLLNVNKVRYLVIGGYAVALHGYPRYTKDLDVWIWTDPDNADRVVKSLKDFGFESLGLTQEDLLEPDTIIQLGYPPNRIDLITNAPGVTFEECFQNKVEIEIDGVNILFIGLDDLKKNKRAAGRLQDLADVDNLE